MPPSNARSLPFLVLLLSACGASGGEPSGAGGSGGGAGGGGGGADICPDHSHEGACVSDGVSSGCDSFEVCTVSARTCPGGERCCTLPLSCQSRLGSVPGGGRCEEDQDCSSGACLQLDFDTRVCLRACREFGGDTCPTGSHCQLVPLDAGASVYACVGGTREAEDREQTTCRSDRDCPEDRLCRILGAADVWQNGAIGVCQVPGEVRDAGLVCGPETWDGSLIQPHPYSSQCEERGLCWTACDEGDVAACGCDGVEGASRCSGFRCAKPCSADEECPNRFVCRDGELGDDNFRPDWSFSVCRLALLDGPSWGCFDETDCCVDGLQRTGVPCCPSLGGVCVQGEPAARTVCTFEPTGARWLSVCRVPAEGKALPGEACGGDGDCQSGLCVATSADGSVCSSPCDLDADRCGSILPGSTCCPSPRATADATLCVPTCRFDCPAEPACAP